ncbi:MAG: glycosyltransferase [Myxococcota bacterium]
MHVVYLINGLGRGGGERMLVQLLQRRPKDITAEVFCLTREGELAQEIRSCGIAVSLLTREGLPKPWVWWRLCRSLWRAQVLHSHFFYADVLGVCLGKILRVPRIVSTRHELGGWMKAWHHMLEKVWASRVDLVLCVSHAVQAGLQRRGCSAAKLRVLPPGVDTAEIDNCQTAPRHILSVGRLEWVKGHDVLLRSFASLRQQGYFQEWMLVVAGDGSQRQVLEELARTLGISQAVTFLGSCSESEVLTAYQAARIFVLPSRSEGLPLALLEALARGLPCIASSVGGIVEVLVDGESGRLVDPGSVEALSAALLDIAERPDVARQLGVCGAHVVRQRYAMETYVEGVFAAYGGS